MLTDTTLERSSRYVEMAAPVTRPPASNEISVNLPNREELSFLDVLAFPNASSKGLDSSTCVSQRADSSSCSDVAVLGAWCEYS